MKVLQTIYDLTAQSGGPSTCVADIMQGLYENGCTVDLLTVKPANASVRNLGDGSAWLKEVDNDWCGPLRWSNNMLRWLKATPYDLYHANTLWVHSSHATCALARKMRRPYLLSPHGMLYPTALAISRWKKLPMLALWFRKDIMKADCLHVTCRQEMEHCRTFGYKGPIAVIPNAVVFPEAHALTSLEKRDDNGRRQIGFLGRLHPIKKVENLLYALELLPAEMRQQLSLQIMGKDSESYETFLRDEVKRLGLDDCVAFVGFVCGDDKYRRLAALTALMVPSAQENFGMIVPEALICETPVYASLGTPWEELEQRNCGWWRDNSPASIAETIKEILSKTDEDLHQMGRNGRQLIAEKYEQHKVAAMMSDLYSWLMGEIEKPDFVFE